MMHTKMRNPSAYKLIRFRLNLILATILEKKTLQKFKHIVTSDTGVLHHNELMLRADPATKSFQLNDTERCPDGRVVCGEGR
jgi:hypothetical protein